MVLCSLSASHQEQFLVYFCSWVGQRREKWQKFPLGTENGIGDLQMNAQIYSYNSIGNGERKV
jgi:hypothetical protein